MSDMKGISQTLKYRRNPLWKKTDRKMVHILLFVTMPMFIVSFAGAVFNNTIMNLGSLVVLFLVLPFVSGMITKKYWRCPGCRNALPNTWIGMRSVSIGFIGHLPVYAEVCPKCGFSLVEGKPPLKEEEILEDKRKQRRRMAEIFGAYGIVMFILLLIVLVLVKKGEI